MVFHYHCCCLRTKIHPSKCEDLIGFIKQLRDWAASYLTSRGELLRFAQNEGFYKEGGWGKKVISKRKEKGSRQGDLSLGEVGGRARAFY